MEKTELTEALKIRHHQLTLGAMASTIAHELSNPLTVIQARAFQLSELLESPQLDLEKIKASVASLQRSADQMTRQLKTVRTFSRLDHGDDSFQFVTMDFLVEKTLRLFKARFPRANYEIQVAPFSDEIEIECIPFLVTAALVHLLTNSAEATEGQESPDLKIKINEFDETIQILIQDSGTGLSIPFDEALRPYVTTKKDLGAQGLGLPIVNDILARHRGKISLTQPNEISVCLPRWQRQNS